MPKALEVWRQSQRNSLRKDKHDKTSNRTDQHRAENFWSVTSIVQLEEDGREAHLGVIEDETGAGVYGRGPRVRCRVGLLTSVKLECLELGLPV